MAQEAAEMNKADAIVTLGLIRQIELQQVATWMLREMLQTLNDLEDEIASAIIKWNPRSARPSVMSKSANNLIREIDDLIEEVLAELARRHSDWHEEIRAITEEDENKNWLLIYGTALAIGSAPKPSINGTPLPAYYEQIRTQLSYRTAMTIRDAVTGQGTPEEIARIFRGQTDLGAGEIAVTKTALETLLRTDAASIPSEVVDRAEPEAIAPHGWQHISVLDNRTTDICRRRAWKRWDANRNPIGHNLPFARPRLHPNCRSRLNLIFLDDPEPKEVLFRQFVESLTVQQQEKLFGRKRVALWQAGTITDAQLIRQTTKEMSIDKLRQRTEDKGAKQTEFPFL